ncbi:MAG: tryptophan-rich sensory protein [Patescibacteria group bacterium]|nr:tryptophan-rich sensory protein [Patescibacteria group bacterium]
MIKIKSWLLLVISLAISLSVGTLGSVFTETGPGTWYDSLLKPWFNPPNWIFAPVWTLLFILMGVALFLVWRHGWKDILVRKGVNMFFIQLAFNLLWSYFFFGLNNPRLAFLEIIALWLAIAALMINFYRVDKRAAWLLWPYLTWVSFAAFLNFSIWQLN